ncbi:hypothetical protein PspLS_02205 [Pyricularia sp. CBS 133598]|nr:hypothetical protein PspLS_02205 [Pyricularia sp. CBS 133598]
MISFSLLFNCILLSLIQYTSADIPPKIYLSDSRNEYLVGQQKGFFCRGYQPKGTHYHEHEVLRGISYVSASSKKNIAIKHAKKTVVNFNLYYVYHIRTEGLTPGVIQSVAAMYRDQNLEYPYPDEDEYAVTGCVPWDNYTIAYIAESYTKLLAARKFFDEIHGHAQDLPLKGYACTLGIIRGRKVVVACPAPDSRPAPSAGIVTNLLHSFPVIRMGLVVGTAGGVPNANHSARLDDVVVWHPRGLGNPTVQGYEGKPIQDQLGRVSRILRTAVAKPPAQNIHNGCSFESQVTGLIQLTLQFRKRYGRLSPNSYKRVYKSDFVWPSSSNSSNEAFPKHHIVRDSRYGYEDDAAIHHGNIARANQPTYVVIRHKGACIILDGLDEAGEEAATFIKTFVAIFLAILLRNREATFRHTTNVKEVYEPTATDTARITEPTDATVNAALLLQHDDNIQSFSSDDRTIALQALVESTNTGFTGKTLLHMFVTQQPYLKSLCHESRGKMDRQQFVEDMTRLMGSFYKRMFAEATTAAGKTVATLLRSHQRRIRISRQMAAQLWQEQEDISVKGKEVNTLVEQKEFNQSISSSDDDDLIAHITELHELLKSTAAYQILLKDFILLFLPKGLRRMIRSTPQEYIRVSQLQDTSVSNTLKSIVEDYTGVRWNWWPFEPRKRLLQDGEHRIYWKCRMVREYSDLPTQLDYQYNPRAGNADAKNPPIPPHVFQAYFYSCPLPCRWVIPHDCIPEQASTENLECIPKRTRNFHQDKDDRSPSVWGLDPVFAVSFAYVFVYHFFILAGPWIYYCWRGAQNPNDLQNPSVPLTIVIGLLSLFWAGAGILTSSGASRRP